MNKIREGSIDPLDLYKKEKIFVLPWSGITISFSWTCLKQEECCDTSESFDIRSPDKRTPLLAVAEILLILVNEPGVVFASHQDDRSVGTESPDLLVPHCPAVLQGDHAASVIAHEHNVSSAIGKPPVLQNIFNLQVRTESSWYTLWWSPNVSHSLRLTSTPSTVTLELSRTWTRDTWHVMRPITGHGVTGPVQTIAINQQTPVRGAQCCWNTNQSLAVTWTQIKYLEEILEGAVKYCYHREKYQISNWLQYLLFGWCYIKENLVENVSKFHVTCHGPLCISGIGQWPTLSARACWGADPGRPGVINESKISTPILNARVEILSNCKCRQRRKVSLFGDKIRI